MPDTLQARLQQVSDTAAQWTVNDPTLLVGEFGYESDTGNLKVGDGSTAWSSLAYYNTGGGLVWTTVSGTTQAASVNNGYIVNNASQVTVTLPASASVGDIVAITGKGAGGWKLAQNASQEIHFADMNTTNGTGGSLESTHRYDVIEVQCITNNTDWVVIRSIGDITVN